MDKNALVLSGGGSRGGYEIGVWQALRELGIELHIITGTSVGALNGAMVIQDDFDAAIALWQELETHMVFDVGEKKSGAFDFEVAGITPAEALAYAKEMITKGGAKPSGLGELIDQYIDEDKVRNSPIELGIVTVQFPAMKPHYLFLPDIPLGRLNDFLLASASCFPAVQAKEISGTKFIDGGYRDVLPIESALEKGATSIVAVDLDAAGVLRKGPVEMAEGETDYMVMIKCYWDLGNFLVFNTENTKRIIRLGYLDTMKAMGAFDGKKFTFIKDTLNQQEIIEAEAAAEIFDLDPALIYLDETINRLLASKIADTPSPDLKGVQSLKNLRKKLNGGTLVLYIADSLLVNGGESNFTRPSAFKVLKNEIMAANYIIRNKLYQ